MMLKHTVILLILLVAVSSAIPPDIPQLNPDDGVLLDSLPEDAYERARSFVAGFLDDYLDDYALGDAEQLYGYGYSLEPIALAFIFTTYYDSISWADYYEVQSLYLLAADLTIDRALSLGPEAPLVHAFSNLMDELRRYNVVVVAFADSEPVVLHCTIVSNIYTQRVSVSQSGLVCLGYILGSNSIRYSGNDEEIIIHYSFGKLYEDVNENRYLMSGGVKYELDNYEDRRKPRYYEMWGVRNYLDDPIRNSGTR